MGNRFELTLLNIWSDCDLAESELVESASGAIDLFESIESLQFRGPQSVIFVDFTRLDFLGHAGFTCTWIFTEFGDVLVDEGA
jgi:hypothetical protein